MPKESKKSETEIPIQSPESDEIATAKATDESPEGAGRVFELHTFEGTRRRKEADFRATCVQASWEAYRLLVSTATQFRSENARTRAGDITLLWDAAECAKWTAEFLLRDSPSALLIASTCAEVCDDVADELESRYEDGTDPQSSRFLDCAEKARNLADLCDQLADESGFELLSRSDSDEEASG